MKNYCGVSEKDIRGVVTLTLSNETRANVLSTEVMLQFTDALDQLKSDASIKALVLRSKGERSFIGGADLKEMAGLDPAAAEEFIRRLKAMCDALRNFPAPVVARIHGWCLGGGLELAASCDIRVASTAAKFAMPEVRMEIPSVIQAALLPRSIGRGRASWLMLTADNVDAEQALQWGMVEKVVEPEELDVAVDDVVNMLAHSSARVLRVQKALLNQWDEMPLSSSIEASVHSFRDSFECGEPNRVMTAYLEARSKSAPSDK
jgi:enoyl-CoA hydratase